MKETELVIAGHLCSVRLSDRFSAIVDMSIGGSGVELCFTKEERPELKQRIMKNLLDSYEQRMQRS